MKVSVWDTYVKRQDGLIMHFDILVPSTLTNETRIYDIGKTYLKSKPFKSGRLTAKECKHCHTEEADQPIIEEIHNNGYYIIEMENCN